MNNNRFTQLALSGTVVLACGFVGCTNSGTQPANEPILEQTTQRSTSGKDHSSMNHSSMNHDLMDHGSMSMSLGPKDEYFDLRFIDGMTPHHEGAIAMAEAALQKSNRPEIKQLAEAIIAAQQQEIQQMQSWRKTWYPSASAELMMYDTQMGHMMPMSEAMKSSMMMTEDLGAADAQFDLRFINAMIPHHQGALSMAKEAAEKSTRPEVIQLSEAILTSQQQEIAQMQQWKQEWYGQ